MAAVTTAICGSPARNSSANPPDVSASQRQVRPASHPSHAHHVQPTHAMACRLLR